jgi:hypothetical protein
MSLVAQGSISRIGSLIIEVLDHIHARTAGITPLNE